MYFIYKLKLVSNKSVKDNEIKNKVSLLCCTNNDEEAWGMVKDESRLYMTKKNERICDQTLTGNTDIVDEMYVIRESKKIHTIEVYKQWREKGTVWGSTRREKKIAEFSMSLYDYNIDCPTCNNNGGYPVTPDYNINTHIMNTYDGNNFIKELKESEVLKNRRQRLDNYSKNYEEYEEYVDNIDLDKFPVNVCIDD